MNEEREEVKRSRRERVEKIWEITGLILLILILFLIVQLVVTIRVCIENNLLFSEGEYTLTSSFIATVILKMGKDGLYEPIIELTPLARFICLTVGIVGGISLLSNRIFPLMDCHYVILWNKKEDYFSVSFPEIYEIVTPIQINCRFHMRVEKKIIKINDGNTILKLPYDKGAETLLWKIQKG